MFLLLIACFQLYAQSPQQFGISSQGIEFIENVGQFKYEDGKAAGDILFKANIDGGELYIKHSGISFVLKKALNPVSRKKSEDRMLRDIEQPEPQRWVISKTEMKFSAANVMTTLEALEPLDSYTNYYIEHEEFTDVRSWRKIVIRNVYQDIDFAIYTNKNNELEYDFIVHPGGNPNEIGLEFINHEGISVENNNLIIANKLGRIEHREPISYQDEYSQRVGSRFIINEDKTISFKVDNYDRAKSLIIDPIIKVWCLGFSGISQDELRDLAVDRDGNVLITGETGSGNLKVLNAFQEEYASEFNYPADGFLAKFDKNGKKLWATYVGGEKSDYPSTIEIDNDNNVIIGGWSWSKKFPQNIERKTTNVLDYLFKFDKNGKYLKHLFLSGEAGERLFDMVVDCNNNIYFAGRTVSNNFPKLLNNDIREREDAIIVKLSAELEVIWSRTIQGNYFDIASDIALDSLGNVYVLGETYSLSLTKAPQMRKDSVLEDIFYARLDTNGNHYWTKIILGNSIDTPQAIEVNSKNEIVILAEVSSDDIYASGFQKEHNYKSDGFVMIIDSTGETKWSTFIAVENSSWEKLYDVKIDRFDNLYISGGLYNKLIYPIEPINPHSGYEDIALIKISTDRLIEWYTFFGDEVTQWGRAIDIDEEDNIYIGFSTILNMIFDKGDIGNYNTRNAGIVKFFYDFTLPGKINGFCVNQQHEIPFILNIKSDTLLTFTVQISDTFDMFEHPITIGEKTTDTSGVILVNIPPDIELEKEYRLRILCSDTTITYTYPELLKVNPVPQAEISGKENPCRTNPTEYLVDLPNEQYSFIWSCSGGRVLTNGNRNIEIEFDSSSTQNIEVIVRNIETGCEQTFSKEISVMDGPEITFDTAPMLCEDSENYKLIEGKPEGGTYVGDYVVEEMFLVREAGPGIHFISYSYTDTNGCTGTGVYSLSITENPDKPEITREADTLYSNYETGNQWYYNDEAIQGAVHQRLFMEKHGNYSVQLKDSNQCTSEMSDIYSFEASVEDVDDRVIIYPNPTEGFIEIRNIIPNTSFYISDLLGNIIYSYEHNDKSIFRLDLSKYSIGIYYLLIDGNIYKIIKL